MQTWFILSKPVNITKHINELKDKNHVMISIGEGKVSETIQHGLMINAPNNVQIEKNTSIIKSYKCS